MMTLEEAIKHCNEVACKHNKCAMEHKQLAEWLNELNELKKIEQKSAWSEEDDLYLLVCKNALEKYQTTDKWDAKIISRWLEDKLKSLRPQITWKPSEGQMKQLGWVAEQNKDNMMGKELMTLYNDLKKLREE